MQATTSEGSPRQKPNLDSVTKADNTVAAITEGTTDDGTNRASGKVKKDKKDKKDKKEKKEGRKTGADKEDGESDREEEGATKLKKDKKKVKEGKHNAVYKSKRVLPSIPEADSLSASDSHPGSNDSYNLEVPLLGSHLDVNPPSTSMEMVPISSPVDSTSLSLPVFSPTDSVGRLHQSPLLFYAPSFAISQQIRNSSSLNYEATVLAHPHSRGSHLHFGPGSHGSAVLSGLVRASDTKADRKKARARRRENRQSWMMGGVRDSVVRASAATAEKDILLADSAGGRGSGASRVTAMQQ